MKNNPMVKRKYNIEIHKGKIFIRNRNFKQGCKWFKCNGVHYAIECPKRINEIYIYNIKDCGSNVEPLIYISMR